MTSIGDRIGSWSGRRVLITGHTGFKGSWLALLLTELGAEVTGLALPAEHAEGLYVKCRVHERVVHHTVDIRDIDEVEKLIHEVRPEVVFHLAAQSLVPRGLRDPAGTFDVNVVGTASVLAGCAGCADSEPATVLVVTSDKVYANDGSGRAFVESDRLGGGDPYSSSKAATELVVASFRSSFFAGEGPVVATVRAGNVVGGGDQADGRLLPDIFRALASGVPVPVRRPDSIRPWQFVLEPLVGYLQYADQLTAGSGLPSSLNFGPDVVGAKSVREIVDTVLEQWGGGSWTTVGQESAVEANILRLDASQARRSLGWRARLDLQTALAWTTEWYRAAADDGNCLALTLRQIHRYLELEHSC